MTAPPDDVSQFMQKRLPATFLQELLRGPKTNEKHNAAQSPVSAPDLDVYLKKIESASQKLIEQAERQHELEEKTYELMQREVQLLTQLDAASRNAAKLEGELEAEKTKLNKAEELLRTAYERLEAKTQALSEADKKLGILTAAIENAFVEQEKAEPERSVAAA